MRDSLVIVPITKPGYKHGISAPLGWLFSNYTKNVLGIYSYELNDYLINNFENFIIQLNWFTELYEVLTIINRIKKFNNKKIMIGGLYSNIMYKKLLKDYDIDFFIKGDAEVPICEFLEGKKLNSIQNLVGKNFNNKHTYIFTESDYKYLDFNLDWFETYTNLFHSNIIYNQSLNNDELNMVCPMIITSKGGCTTVHDGCDYCLGSKHDLYKSMYNRKPITVSNKSLITMLYKISSKYKRAALYITSPYIYDLSGHYFDIEINVEIDSYATPDQVKAFTKSFRKSNIWLSISKDGLMSRENIVYDIEPYKTNDKNHKIKFLSYTDSNFSDITDKDKYITQNLDTVFAYEEVKFDNYIDFNKSMDYSYKIYKETNNGI